MIQGEVATENIRTLSFEWNVEEFISLIWVESMLGNETGLSQGKQKLKDKC